MRTLVLALLVAAACHRARAHTLTKADLEHARALFHAPRKHSSVDEWTASEGGAQ